MVFRFCFGDNSLELLKSILLVLWSKLSYGKDGVALRPFPTAVMKFSFGQ